MARFEFTRPITKDGDTTAYWDILKDIQGGAYYNRADANRMGKYMTFQALREAGLLDYSRTDGWELTQNGADYIAYYENNAQPQVSWFECDETTEQDIVSMYDEVKDSLPEVVTTSTTNGLYSITITKPNGDSKTINVSSCVADAITTLVEA